jgi:hypothetical protein
VRRNKNGLGRVFEIILIKTGGRKLGMKKYSCRSRGEGKK